MDERQLRENLRRLPEARAADGFTEAVLARLETEDARTAPRPVLAPAVLRPALAAVALVAVVTAVVVLLSGGPAPEQRADGPEVPAVADGGPPEAAVGVPAAAGRTADAGAAPAAEPAAPTPDREPASRGPVSRGAEPASAEPAATGPAATRPAKARLAELRRERQRLLEQLAALEALPRQEPKLLLGGDESVELVLDLGRPDLERGGVRPAAYRPPSDSGGGPRYH